MPNRSRGPSWVSPPIAGDRLSVIEKAAKSAGVPCQLVHRIGEHPSEEIIKTAMETGCDAIFMASHGRRGISALVLGSETTKVLTHTKLPVVVYRWRTGAREGVLRMDVPLEMVASQLTLEWEALMQALWTGLTGAVILATLAVAVGGGVMASCRTYRPRRFWCRSTGRDVEVLFEEWGPPGFRQTLRVAQCSAFEPASAIGCRRTCLDETCRSPAAPFGLSELHARPG